MVMVWLLLLVGSDIEVAVMVSWSPTGMAGGAVNTLPAPLAVCRGTKEGAPHESAGVQDHVTPAFAESLDTVATTLLVVFVTILVGNVEITTEIIG
jgi:hypothetical protein